MKDALESLRIFLGVRMSTDGIGEMSLKQQAVELINKIIEPWLNRLTMKKIGDIVFAAGHGFGNAGSGFGGLRVKEHCRRNHDFPRGKNFKTRVFLGPDLRYSIKNEYASSGSITKYRELYWALTRRKQWLQVEIYYEIEYCDKCRTIKNTSLVVRETSLTQLVGNNWSHSILAGLFKEIQRSIDQKVKDMQELFKLQSVLEIIDGFIRREAAIEGDGLAVNNY